MTAEFQTENASPKRAIIPLTLGIISILIGSGSLLFGWIPHYGMLAIPVAVIGGFFGIFAFIASLFSEMRWIKVSVSGILVCGVGIILPITSTMVDTTVSGREMASAHEEIMKNLLQEVEEERMLLSQHESYISDYLQINELSVRNLTSEDGEIQSSITLKISNNGSKTLSLVEVQISVHGENGELLSEESFTPINMEQDSRSSLAPGETWTLDDGASLLPQPLSNDWSEGNITATITQIQFAD